MTQCASRRCGGGCCSDFSSRAEQKPSLLQIDVVENICQQAIRNMTKRAIQRDAGLLSDDDYNEAFSTLVNWIALTFSGENRHYHTDPEWHQGEGLKGLLKERLVMPQADREELFYTAATYFAQDADRLATSLVATGGFKSPDAEGAILALANGWAQLLTGAPTEG